MMHDHTRDVYDALMKTTRDEGRRGYYIRCTVRGNALRDGDRCVDQDGNFGTVVAHCVACQRDADEHPALDAPAEEWVDLEDPLHLVSEPHAPVWEFSVHIWDRYGNADGYAVHADESYEVFRALDDQLVHDALGLLETYVHDHDKLPSDD